MPTIEQNNKIQMLQKQGYIWDEQLSISYAAVVLKKGDDLWVFGLDGTISNNPKTIHFSV